MRTCLLTVCLVSAVSTSVRADLSIVELGGEKTLKWTAVQTPNLSIALTIENSGKTAVTNVVVDATPFQGSGHSAMVRVNGASPPFNIGRIESNSSQVVTLTADLPAAATYRTFVTLRESGAAAVRAAVEVERVRATAPIETSNMPAELISILWSARTVAFQSTLVSTGDAVKLDAPSLQSVTYSEKAAGATPENAPSVGMIGSPPIGVGAEPLRVPLTLTGIDRAGRYDAVVRFTGPGYAGKDVTLTVYAREHFAFALCCIALGVAVSVLLRAYSNVIRPRLFNERRAATLFAELDELATRAHDDAEAVSVIQGVRRRLTDHWNTLSASGALAVGNALDVFDKKLLVIPSWIDLRARVASLPTDVLRTPFEDQLSTAKGVLINRTADAAAVDVQSGILETMPVEIDKAVKNALQQQLTELKQQVAGDIRPQVEPVRHGIGAIEQHLAEGRLRQAASDLDALQRRYIGILIDDLSGRLVATAPVGVADREWSDAITMIAAALARARSASTASAASEGFRGALTLFLNTITAGLARDVADKIVKSKFKDEYTALKSQIDAIQQQVRAGDFLTAWKDVEKAQTVYNALVMRGTASLGAAETVLGAIAAAPQTGPEFDVSQFWIGGASATDLARGDAMQVTQSKLQTSQLAISVLIFVIAVLIGFKTLWVDNLTWGGWTAYLVAFLWGVGFDQLGHAGLVAMIRKG